MEFLAIDWTATPEIFEIKGFALRWYGILFAAGFIVGQYVMVKFFTLEGKPAADVDTLTIYMVASTVLGARLGHCFFYDPDYYLSNPIKILFVWEGGLASHGAAFGILFGLWLYSRKMNQGYLWIVDRIVVVVALAGCFIRFGNLMNSEIVGSPSNLPWAFIFHNSVSLSAAERIIPRHPSQLYESITCLILFFLLYFYYMKKQSLMPEGRLLGIFLVYVFGLRFFYEFIKENQEEFENGMLLNMGQLLSIPLVLVGVWLLYKSFASPTLPPHAKKR